ncbi:type I toxin-antitoxin system Fst family toxin [Selenomonas ruminantium]|uniref:type I toxin-antitoxin system Fst family toxin n=1 Tax=Selenomonas ruminantium TaxID=971 RepID=UPI003527D028
MSTLDILSNNLYLLLNHVIIYVPPQKGCEYCLFERIMELILAPLIVGILVELFSYWLNH